MNYLFYVSNFVFIHGSDKKGSSMSSSMLDKIIQLSYTKTFLLLDSKGKVSNSLSFHFKSLSLPPLRLCTA